MNTYITATFLFNLPTINTRPILSDDTDEDYQDLLELCSSNEDFEITSILIEKDAKKLLEFARQTAKEYDFPSIQVMIDDNKGFEYFIRKDAIKILKNDNNELDFLIKDRVLKKDLWRVKKS